MKKEILAGLIFVTLSLTVNASNLNDVKYKISTGCLTSYKAHISEELPDTTWNKLKKLCDCQGDAVARNNVPKEYVD